MWSVLQNIEIPQWLGRVSVYLLILLGFWLVSSKSAQIEENQDQLIGVQRTLARVQGDLSESISRLTALQEMDDYINKDQNRRLERLEDTR